jgi:hypothetical protein
MKENHTYLIASLEGGYLFNKPDRRFRFGLGLGMDFNTDLNSSILENTLIRNNTTTTYVEGGPNAGTTTTSTMEEFDNTSAQWASTVGSSEVFWLMPKVGFSAYYDITERLGLSLKANARFLFHRRYAGADLKLKVRYPSECRNLLQALSDRYNSSISEQSVGSSLQCNSTSFLGRILTRKK